MDTASLPFKLHTLLCQYLDIPSLLPALKGYRLLRDDESLSLSRRWEAGYRRASVEELLALLPRTGPYWKEELYRVIKASVYDESADSHRGHKYIIDEWKKKTCDNGECNDTSVSLEKEVQCLRQEVRALSLRVKELEDQLLTERMKRPAHTVSECRKQPAPTLVQMLHEHLDEVRRMLEELRGLVETATPLNSTKMVGETLERVKMLSALSTHIKLKCREHSYMVEQDLQTSLAQLDIATKAFKLTLYRSTPTSGLQSDQALYVILTLSVTISTLAKYAVPAADLLWQP